MAFARLHAHEALFMSFVSVRVSMQEELESMPSARAILFVLAAFLPTRFIFSQTAQGTSMGRRERALD